ncbi:DNA-binding protein [Haloferax sp. MBLA0078]|uniref:DNA-binding protein n=2 Tax=Haloferacaceae TaxID=1644056 RepID=A0A6A8G768_9EURY|nr:DNA-binding protein [Haloferax sp. CBA1150]MRW96979.1 DNA-binding protein [Haloferax marinum]
MGDAPPVTGYEVELGCPLDGSYLGAALEDSDLEIVFVPGVQTSETPVPYFTAQGPDVDVVDDLLESHAGVEEYELVADGREERLYRCRWVIEEDGIISTIRTHDGIVRQMEGSSDGWVLSVFFPTNEHAAQFHDACLEQQIAIDIRRVERSRLDRRQLPNYGLSEKQLTALELAFVRGYFETPKESSLTNIAAEIDISEQALSQRLRRALNHLVESAIDGGEYESTKE